MSYFGRNGQGKCPQGEMSGGEYVQGNVWATAVAVQSQQQKQKCMDVGVVEGKGRDEKTPSHKNSSP